MAMKFGEGMSNYTLQFLWVYLFTHAIISVLQFC